MDEFTKGLENVIANYTLYNQWAQSIVIDQENHLV